MSTALVDPTSAASDVTDVLARAAGGSADAWIALYDRYHRLVLAVTRAQGLPDSDTADIAQDTWVALLEHHGDIRDPAALVSWLATTAQRRSSRRRRHIVRHTSLEERHDRAVVFDVDERIDADRRHRALHEALACLPRREQALITAMLDPDEPSYKEIAARLDMPVGSIGPTRQRALRHLRAILEADGVTCPWSGATAA